MCTPNTASTPRIGTVVAALCFTAVVLDGYDLIIYGAVVPSLLSYPEWHLSAEQAGAYGSYALIGMLIGAVSSGLITDVLGRRKLMLICTTWFSIGTALCALAPTPELFGVLRFLAGLGLGGLLPTAISLTNEYAPPHRKQLYNGAMTTGYAVGGIVASLLALLLIPTFGFRSVFLAGGAPIIVLFPLLSRYLPESASFLSSRGRVDEARTLLARYGLPPVMDQPAEPRHAHEQAPARLLFSTPYLPPTLIFGAANFCGLLLSYGMSTWLPATMRTAGYALNSSLAFLLTLNVGAIIGVITGSLIADRIGSRITISSCYLIAGICIALLSASPPIFVLYLLVAISGFGAIGTQILLNGYVANYYPTRARGSALGWSLGVGRVGGICGPLVGGLIIGAAIGFQWNFYVFGLTAVLAGTLVAFIAPQRPEPTSPEPSSADAKGVAE